METLEIWAALAGILVGLWFAGAPLVRALVAVLVEFYTGRYRCPACGRDDGQAFRIAHVRYKACMHCGHEWDIKR